MIPFLNYTTSNCFDKLNFVLTSLKLMKEKYSNGDYSCFWGSFATKFLLFCIFLSFSAQKTLKTKFSTIQAFGVCSTQMLVETYKTHIL